MPHAQEEVEGDREVSDARILKGRTVFKRVEIPYIPSLAEGRLSAEARQAVRAALGALASPLSSRREAALRSCIFMLQEWRKEEGVFPHRIIDSTEQSWRHLLDVVSDRVFKRRSRMLDNSPESESHLQPVTDAELFMGLLLLGGLFTLASPSFAADSQCTELLRHALQSTCVPCALGDRLRGVAVDAVSAHVCALRRLRHWSNGEPSATESLLSSAIDPLFAARKKKRGFWRVRRQSSTEMKSGDVDAAWHKLRKALPPQQKS